MATAPDNAETVRTAFEHLNRRDVESLAGLCDDEFHLDMSDRVFNPDEYHGHAGLRRFLADVDDCWESYRWNVVETRVSGVVVVATLDCEGQGRHGVRVGWRVAWLWTFRGATPVSARLYRDVPAAAASASRLALPERAACAR